MAIFVVSMLDFRAEGLIEGASRLLAAIIVHKSCANSNNVASNIGKKHLLSESCRGVQKKKCPRVGWIVDPQSSLWFSKTL